MDPPAAGDLPVSDRFELPWARAVAVLPFFLNPGVGRFRV